MFEANVESRTSPKTTITSTKVVAVALQLVLLVHLDRQMQQSELGVEHYSTRKVENLHILIQQLLFSGRSSETNTNEHTTYLKYGTK